MTANQFGGRSDFAQMIFCAGISSLKLVPKVLFGVILNFPVDWGGGWGWVGGWGPETVHTDKAQLIIIIIY